MEKSEKKVVEEKYPAQVKFMDHLRKTAPSHISLVDEISDLLNISTDGAYRRMRSETALSFDEWVALSKHFQIPSPSFNSPDSQQVMFSYQPMGNSMDKFERYLLRILNNLRQVQQVPGHRLTFAAEHVPMFQYFNHKPLTAFKFYYWNYCILGASELKGKKFEPNSLTDSLYAVAQTLFDTYCQINCREIWTEDTITGVLRQLEFFWESEHFAHKDDALEVCDELKKMILNIESFAQTGKKYSTRASGPNQTYQLYNSEVMIGNTSVLVETGNIKSAYVAYNTFSSMDTQDEGFCGEVEQWIDNLIQKSLLLSGQGERHRGKFIRTMIASVERLETRIKG